MKKSVIFLILGSMLPGIHAQQVYKYEGKLVDDASQPVAGAYVSLLAPADSALLAGGSANGEGQFAVSCQADKVLARISCVGYKTVYRLFADTQVGTIVMAQDAQQLKEVVVAGRDMVRKGNRLQAFPSERVRKNARDGYSALALMMIPDIDVDIISRTVSSSAGGVLLCINGREVKDDEVRTLDPKDIKSIDYYQNYSHPQYPQAATVIDFVMINREHGGTVSMAANEHLNRWTGDDLADVKMFRKKSEVNIQLAGNYNHFTQKRGEESTTELQFPTTPVTKTIETTPSAKNANGLNGKLAYLHKGKGSMFHAVAYLQGGHDADGHNLLQRYSGSTADVTTQDYTHRDNFSPAGQVSYQHVSPKKHMLRTKLYGSYNHTTLNRDYRSTASYLSQTKENFRYLNPEFMYNFPVSRHVSLFTHDSYYYSHISNAYTENGNAMGSKLINGLGIFSVGTNLNLTSDLFMVIRLADRMQTVDNGVESHTDHYIAPAFMLNYYMPHHHSIRWSFAVGNDNPEMKYYSRSEQRLDEYQTLTGNPDIDVMGMAGTNVFYAYRPKWGVLEFATGYEHKSKSIYEQVDYDGARNLFVHSYQNGGSQNDYYARLTGQVKLIPKKLNVQANVLYRNTEQRHWYDQHLSQFLGSLMLTYMNHNVDVRARLATPQKQLDDGYLTTMPTSLSLDLGYTVKDWHFTLNMKNPFINAPVKVQHTGSQYKYETRNYQPRVSDNVFLLGVSYRFSYGKKHRYENIDIDTSNRSGILSTKERK